MEYEDRLILATPEGVEVDLVVAGIGSRFIALAVDTTIQLAVIGAISAAAAVLGNLGVALFAVVGFLVFFGYPVLFEVVGRGRTPGKRLAGIQVVASDASPVRFVPSAVRNIVRIIDSVPGVYAVGIVAVLLSPRNQRLGDMAASTLVVRDRPDRATPVASPGWAWAPVELPPDAGAWDLSAVTADEVATVRAFLGRRAELDPQARYRLGYDLAVRLQPKVSGPPEHQGPERFLELVIAAKDAR